MTDSLKPRPDAGTLAGTDADRDSAVFAEPWEARAFALALMLSERGRFSWDEFRERLIAEIARTDAAASHERHTAAASPRGPYYECWLAALEKLLREKALLDRDEIERRAEAIAASPPAPTRSQGHRPIKIA